MDRDKVKIHSSSKYNVISRWTRKRHEKIFKQIRNSLGESIKE